MTLVEVTPENDYWNKQKVLYAYDTDRVATLFDESTENEKIYGYQFLNGDVQELIDDDIHSWEDAERVFLEIITDLLDDEAKYYDELKNMCKELISLSVHSPTITALAMTHKCIISYLFKIMFALLV